MLFDNLLILPMNSQIRQKITQRLARKAGLNTEHITFKHCAHIASHLECDPNSVARLFGISSFKPTQMLKPDIEQKIADFLGFTDFEALEEALMHEIVWDKFQDYYKDKLNF